MNHGLRIAPRLIVSTALAVALLPLPNIVAGVMSTPGATAAYAQGGGGGGGGGGGSGSSGGMGNGHGMGQGGHGMDQGAGSMSGQHMSPGQDRMGGMHMNADMIRNVQRALNDMGYHAGPPDGMMGPRTHAAVAAYQSHHGMMADGNLSADLAKRIQSDAQKK